MFANERKTENRFTTRDLLERFSASHRSLNHTRLAKRLIALKRAGLLSPAKGDCNADLYSERDAEMLGRLLELESKSMSISGAVKALKDGSEPAQLAPLSRAELMAIIQSMQKENESLSTMLVQAHMGLALYIRARWWKRLWWSIFTERSPLFQGFRSLFTKQQAQKGGCQCSPYSP